MFEPGELQTETFTNSQGWTVVRVTHVATGESAERERTKTLVSSVQAQRECIAELRDRIETPGGLTSGSSPATDAAVSRQEFNEFVTRVRALEQQLGRDDVCANPLLVGLASPGTLLLPALSQKSRKMAVKSGDWRIVRLGSTSL